MNADRTQVRMWTVRLAQALTFAALLGAWQVVGRNDSLFLSQPSAVASDFGRWFTDETRRSAWIETMKLMLVGGLLGLTIGVLVGFAFATLRWVRLIFGPFVAAGNAVPKVALAPVFISILGINFHSRVYFVASLVLFISLYTVDAAWRSVDQDVVTHVVLLGGGRLSVFRRVYLPSVSSAVLTSARQTVVWAMLAAIVSEFIVQGTGIGSFLTRAQQGLQSTEVWSAIVVLALTSLVMDRTLNAIDGRVNSWRVG